MTNPFDVTKAVDFDDKEIGETFVNFSGSGPRFLADPSQSMPKFLLGGKGGGRTHLLRYFSYQLQRTRAKGDVLSQITADGYLGVYTRASGLNSRRFEEKGKEQSAWDTVFAYYMDVWLSQILVKVLFDLERDCEWPIRAQREFADELYATLGDGSQTPLDLDVNDPIDEILAYLTRTLQTMDRSINLASLGEPLTIDPKTRPGELVFSAAKAASRLPGLEGARITFLIDEFENLTEGQQVYVNTLIREKERPTGFLVGSRTWGFRTRSTWSAGEENKLGSEYEQVVLEDAYRTDDKAFESFCRDMVSRRLKAAGVEHPDRLNEWFGGIHASPTEYALSLVGKYEPENRPHFNQLRQHFDAVGQTALGAKVARKLSFPNYPDYEKLALLQVYRLWSKTGSASDSDIERISRVFSAHLGGRPDPSLRTFVGHWRSDMLAQLAVETGNKVPYLGFDQYIEMAGYLPRNLLVTLKSIVTWSEGYDEHPFSTEVPVPMSERATAVGIRQASDWFAMDAKPLGVLGVECERAIDRLGSFLRRMRFSSRPTEPSCATIAAGTAGLSRAAIEVLNGCVGHNLLVRLGDGRRERNSGELQGKYQLHPMLAPRYDLPTARRGYAALHPDEMNAIFDPTSTSADFAAAVNRRLSPMTAPFGIARAEALFDD